MKYNISDILENSNVEETEEFIDNIRINYNETIAQKIKERVITEEKEQRNKHSKISRFSLKTIIAFAAVFAIILCSITAGAAINFKMDKTFSKVFNDKNIDLNTIASDVNIVSEYNGYKFKLTQVICDGRAMYCAFDCPTENGEMLVPEDVEITINGKTPYHYSCIPYVFNRVCYLIFINADDNHIKSNSQINIKVNRIIYNYDMNRDDIAEKLLATGKVTKEEIEEALKDESKIYKMADEILYEKPVYSVDEESLDESREWPSIDGEWSFEFNTSNADVIRTIDADKVYPYDDDTYIEISPLGAYVISSKPRIASYGYENVFCIEMKDGTVYTDKDTAKVENGYHDGVHSFGHYDAEKNYGRTIANLFLSEFINPDNVKSVTYQGVLLYEEKA